MEGTSRHAKDFQHPTEHNEPAAGGGLWMRGIARVGTMLWYLQGLSIGTACRASQSEQGNGWFFGSGATRSRARLGNDEVRACPGGGLGRIIDGHGDGLGTTGTFAL